MHLWVTPQGMRGNRTDTGLSPSVRWVDSGRTRWALSNLLISRDLVPLRTTLSALYQCLAPACLAPACTPAGSSPGNQVGLWGNLLVLFLFFLQAQFNTPLLTPQCPFSWLWPLESQTTCASPSQAALGQPCRDGKMEPSPGSTPFPPQMQFSVPTWIWLTFPKSIPGRGLIEAHRTVPSFVLGTLLLRMCPKVALTLTLQAAASSCRLGMG